ncbi:MAG: sigma-70 family RNA polymerase sigma factor [Bacteroidota bacterium]
MTALNSPLDSPYQSDQALSPSLRNYIEQAIDQLSIDKKYKEDGLRQLYQRISRQVKQHVNPSEAHKEEGIRQIIYKLAEKEVLKDQQAALKNFGLSEAAFNDMLRQLQQGDKSLFEKIFLSHFQDCRNFLKYRYKASDEDAYDASMEAMLTFCKRLKEGKIAYGNLRFLFTRMAGQIYLKWIKKQLPQESIEGLEIPEKPEELDRESMAILNIAWSKLCQDCSGLLKAFYYEGIPLKDIASLRGKSASAIRKQKQRCMEKLQTLFAEHFQNNS